MHVGAGDNAGFEAEYGRITAKPDDGKHRASNIAERPGLHWLGLDKKRDAALYIPQGYQIHQPCPLIVTFHGAGGNATNGLNPLRPFADEMGLLLLSPASQSSTWDIIEGHQYGPDVAFLNRALAQVFERVAVNPRHIAISGFSDGASYALSLGLMNGDLFQHVVAFSPGFMAPADQRGMPGVYISHGTDDRVLPIDRCSRPLVPRLQNAGYSVRYREFTGGHTVPPFIAQEAANWVSGKPV
jgi:predicted esterase